MPHRHTWFYILQSRIIILTLVISLVPRCSSSLQSISIESRNSAIFCVGTTTCGPYFGTTFEGAQFFICCTDRNHSTYRRETKYLPFVFLPHKQTSACVYKTFMRTDQSGRNIQCPIRFMLQQAKTWEEMWRVQVPISKHSQTAIFWAYQSPSKEITTTSYSTSHGQEVRNLAKVPYWQCTCPSRLLYLLGTFGHGNISIPPLRAQNYSTIRLLMLRVRFDGIWPRTPELEHLPRTAFIRCVWNLLFPIKAPFAKTMLLFWSLHFLSAFFHKISSNVSRNMLKIQTESYFHLTMSKWPILTPKL